MGPPPEGLKSQILSISAPFDSVLAGLKVKSPWRFGPRLLAAPQPLCCVVAEDDRAERIATVPGYHVDTNAALSHFDGIGPCHIADFLQAAVVPVHAAVRAVRAQVVQPHSLDRLHGVDRAPVEQRRLLQATRAANVTRDGAGAAHEKVGSRNQYADRLDVTPRWHRVEHVARHGGPLRDSLHVHDWRARRDRHRRLERADGQHDVDLRRKVRRELHIFLLRGAESRESESNGIRPWSEPHDLVLSGCVAGRRSNFFDQRGARRFHPHSRDNRARRVFDRARDRARLG